MLAITTNAAQAIDGILSASEMPEGSGLRITSEAAEGPEGPRTDLRLSLTAEPQDGDQISDQGQVFIEPNAATLLDDKLLDVDVSGNEVQFSLHDQAEQPE